MRCLGLAAFVGICAGLASAVFLLILDMATELRLTQAWLIDLLPVGGFLVGLLYHSYGRAVQGGNNLILEELHNPRKVIPLRMAPLVLLGTVLTHLFGGSAGREGTAVQMGASLADQLTKRFKLAPPDRGLLLMAGMSGGFGSVFGVPWAGMIFGLEVLTVGQPRLRALAPCAVSAFVAHYVTLGFGVHHTPYPPLASPSPGVLLILSVIAAGLLFGSAARLFSWLMEQISHRSKSLIPHLPLRAMIGGGMLLLIYKSAPLMLRYSGLGVPLIVDSLKVPVPLYDWLGKLSMTALTLGMGFKGGEVTPLLFIGSTFGNALSGVLPAPLDLLSALGLVAVFAGAANTPITCTIMAVELFGWPILPYAALACFCSYLASSHHGIYTSQRVEWDKRAYLRRGLKRLRSAFRQLV